MFQLRTAQDVLDCSDTLLNIGHIPVRNIKHIPLSFCIFGAALSNAAELNPISPAVMSLSKMELGEAIRLFMPDKGTKKPIMWNYRANESYIVWQDNAFTMNPSGTYTFREGLMRLTVNGVSPTILANKVKEMGWTITLATKSAPKFGIEEIGFAPGRDDGKYNCFGSAAENCTFNPLRSLQKAGVKVAKVCSRKDGMGGLVTGYKLTAPNKDAVFGVLVDSVGSGGASTDLSINFVKSAANLCTEDQN